MKLVSMNCPSCGAQLDIDADKSQAFCRYCGNSVRVDDEVQRVEHTVEYANAEDAGYKFEKGRQRAMAEGGMQVAPAPSAAPEPAPKKRNTVLWVLGWILIFPVPLTIIMLRKKDLKPAVRYGVIVAAWLVYLGIGFASGNSKGSKSTSTESEIVATQSKGAEADEKKETKDADDGAAADVIVLEAGKQNEYSSTLILNEGTDLKEERVIYDVPAGRYNVTNVGDHRTQVSVYSHETVQSGGVTEPADVKVEMLDAGEAKDIEIPNGYYIYISEPSKIELAAK